MKKFLATTIAFSMLACTTTAIATTYTDTFNPGATYMDDGGWTLIYGTGCILVAADTISWTFDITDDGFDPDAQDITAASIVLNF